MKTDEVNNPHGYDVGPKGELIPLESGAGGTFEIRDGKRIRVSKPGEPHKEGDRARHADETPADKGSQTAAEPALTAPPASPFAAASETAKGE